MKKIYQYGILSGFLALCACGNNSDNMDASGTFEATEVIVSAEANGKIEQLDIEEGSIVTARQKLGYIDTVQLYLQKEQLLKNIRSVESNRPDIQDSKSRRPKSNKGELSTCLNRMLPMKNN